MDIYELLKKGKDPEELFEEFTEEVGRAQTRLAKEKEEEELRAKAEKEAADRQAKAREALTAALRDFALAYEIVDEWDEETSAEWERQMVGMLRTLEIAKKCGSRFKVRMLRI